MKITVIITDETGEVLFQKEESYNNVNTSFSSVWDRPVAKNLNGATAYYGSSPANFVPDPPEEAEIEYKPNF